MTLRTLGENVNSLCNVISKYSDSFESQDVKLVNILTHAVLSKKTTEDILKRDEVGQKLFEQFILRFDGKMSLFKTSNKTINITSEKGKIIKLKERNLLQRFIIISRSCIDLNLEKYLGYFQFGVVPRTLFSDDGTLLPMKNKYKVSSMIIKAVEDELKNKQIYVIKESCENDNSLHKVILFDAMAVLNALPKDSYGQLKT